MPGHYDFLNSFPNNAASSLIELARLRPQRSMPPTVAKE